MRRQMPGEIDEVLSDMVDKTLPTWMYDFVEQMKRAGVIAGLIRG